MKLRVRPLESEADFWRIRNFARRVFLANGRHEIGWHVARLDYWRWHFLENLQFCPKLEEVMFLWEDGLGDIQALLHPFSMAEAFLVINPAARSADLEHEMLSLAESSYAPPNEQGDRRLFVMSDAQDELRMSVLAERGYAKRPMIIHRWWRHLDPDEFKHQEVTAYQIRAMGEEHELPARGWASWLAFHPDEPVEAYQNDGGAWFKNVQRAPLYRRDLDLVAVTQNGEIASFCTIFYDDFTRSAVCVLVGTVPEHQRRGLGKALLREGFRRLAKLGATRVFANAYDPPADALYGSALGRCQVSHSWVKTLPAAAVSHSDS